MEAEVSAAFFSLSQAQYAAGNFHASLMESVSIADYRVVDRVDNVAGVKLPAFTGVTSGTMSSEFAGLSGGGTKIQACRDKFRSLLSTLIKLASLQASFTALDEALKVTNRRVNALDTVTLPQLEATIKKINNDLHELENEDFVRIKKVQANKDKARKEAETRQGSDQEKRRNFSNPEGHAGQYPSILAQFESSADPDVVFSL